MALIFPATLTHRLPFNPKNFALSIFNFHVSIPLLKAIVTWIEASGAWAPWCFVGLFIAASFLMIWRLEVMSESGFEGTVLGTLIMPYCSGIGNLIFAFVLGTKRGPASEVLTNALVNNVTNMTLLIGLPAALWGMNVLPASKSKKKKTNRKEHQ